MGLGLMTVNATIYRQKIVVTAKRFMLPTRTSAVTKEQDILVIYTKRNAATELAVIVICSVV